MIIVTDTSNNVVWVNKAFEDFTGYILPVANLLGLIDLINNSSDLNEKIAMLALVNESAKKIDEIIHRISNKVYEAEWVS